MACTKLYDIKDVIKMLHTCPYIKQINYTANLTLATLIILTIHMVGLIVAIIFLNTTIVIVVGVVTIIAYYILRNSCWSNPYKQRNFKLKNSKATLQLSHVGYDDNLICLITYRSEVETKMIWVSTKISINNFIEGLNKLCDYPKEEK